MLFCAKRRILRSSFRALPCSTKSEMFRLAQHDMQLFGRLMRPCLAETQTSCQIADSWPLVLRTDHSFSFASAAAFRLSLARERIEVRVATVNSQRQNSLSL